VGVGAGLYIIIIIITGIFKVA